MAAPKGNHFWRARSKHGRDKIFSTPDALWESCTEFFDWVEENPLRESVVYQGKIMDEGSPLIRAMTISGLCLFLGVCEKTWANYRQQEGYLQVITRVEAVIYNQKFTGAAAGLLNANIIARDLGLRDKQETTHKGVIGVKDVTDMDEDDVDSEIKGLLGND